MFFVWSTLHGKQHGSVTVCVCVCVCVRERERGGGERERGMGGIKDRVGNASFHFSRNSLCVPEKGY